ncbi:MAG: outer membrane beta-barrel protein [Lacibacter sp.]
MQRNALRRIVFSLSLLFISVFSFSQSLKLNGRVLNQKNEPVAAASITVEGTTKAIAADIEGRFTLLLESGKKYTISVSAIGYQTKSINEVEVKANDANTLEVVLEVAAKQGTEIIIQSTAKKESTNSLIAYQKNTNTLSSVISAENIRRSPDRNTGEILRRTTGASVQEGKFIIIRGLADRYNQAMLNGVLLSSTEPDRKTFSFDLIPASMIDNIIINKAFAPEYPGEWAGGLIQVNTKDIPSKNFFNIQVGTSINSQTVGRAFYTDKRGGSDWLGIDDGTRSLPSAYTRKSAFDTLSSAQKTAIGKQMRNSWMPVQRSTPVNFSLQANGGFSGKLFGKKIGGTLGINYSKSGKILELVNRSNALSNGVFTKNYDYEDTRYAEEITAGALGSIALQINSRNKLSFKSIINLTSPQRVTKRSGIDYNRAEDMQGSEITFKQNTFLTTLLSGDHNLTKDLKLKWYGAFNLLDGYTPDQRRIAYTRATGTQNPFSLLISNSLSQQSGSRIYQTLSDYIYTAGGDLNYSFALFDQKQNIKGGYMFQVKDRLYDAQLFANYLPLDNPALRLLPADVVFNTENFGDGTGNKFAFDAIKGKTFRYMANTILNSGFIQFDNQFSKSVRVVWGLRVEHYDQLVGSVKTWDPRHTHSKVIDFLPGVNAIFKVSSKTNVRLSLSQTVIRPELRELAYLNLYDFELNASVQGNPALKRTKISNVDLRYEFYQKPGEMFTVGVFYKNFVNPIEQLFNEGAGGSSTFSYQNAAEANTYGVELELRKRLDFIAPALKNFIFQSNASYINSRVKDKQFNINRPLQGQSPYVLNLGLLYDLEKAELTGTILFNQVGPRIYLVGDLSSGSGSPDIYEAPRSLLDFQLSKKVINKKGEIKLTISDLLNTTQYFYQNADSKTTLQKNADAYRFTRKDGTTFGISFNYSL